MLANLLPMLLMISYNFFDLFLFGFFFVFQLRLFFIHQFLSIDITNNFTKANHACSSFWLWPHWCIISSIFSIIMCFAQDWVRCAWRFRFLLSFIFLLTINATIAWNDDCLITFCCRWTYTIIFVVFFEIASLWVYFLMVVTI